MLITIIEPQFTESTRGALEEASGLSIAALAEVLRPLLKCESNLSGESVFLSPKTTVGTVRVGDLRIDVKSRLSTANLVTLIRYAYEGDYTHARSEIRPDVNGLDELLCGLLVDELDMIRQRGVSRLYVNRKRSLNALRGRPDFLASFPWNDRGMTGITCRFHELSCDTLDNQLILAVLDRAVLMDVLPTTRGRLNAHRHAWHELASVREVSSADFGKARSSYTRFTTHYSLAHNVGAIILSHLRPEMMYEEATVITAGIALDMAELFELAAYRIFKQYLEPIGYSVRPQQSDSHALHDGEGRRYRSIRPDVVIYRDDVAVAVIDAKYKDLWEAVPGTSEPKRRIGNDDLYQLFFYATRFQAVHHLPRAPAAIILSPIASGLELIDKSVIGQRYQRVEYTAGSSMTCLSLIFCPLSAVIEQLAVNRFDVHCCPEIATMMASLLLTI